MNKLPLIVGGGAAVPGIAGGVLAERSSHAKLESDKQRINADANEWLAGANREFGDEMEADRLRNRAVGDKVEDYRLENPPPGEVSFGRGDAGWSTHVAQPDRENFWFAVGAGGGFAGGSVGALTLAAAADGGIRTGGQLGAASIGAGILGAGLGVAVGSIVSNWTH